MRLNFRLMTRRRRVFAMALALGTGGSVMPLGAQAPAPTGADLERGPVQAGAIVVVGDSLSAEYGIARGSGWVELLRRRLGERGAGLDVVNASISGDTTAGGLSRIEGVLRRHSPAVLIIELGGNDALRGLDLQTSRSNLLTMIVRARKYGARVLLVGMRMPPNYGRRYAESFEQLYAQVAAEARVPLVPFLLEGFAERMDLYQADRIHPNEAAQIRMLDNVWPALSALLAGR